MGVSDDGDPEQNVGKCMILAESGHELGSPHVRRASKKERQRKTLAGEVFQQNSDLPQPGGTDHSGMISLLQNPTCTVQE